MQVRKNIPVKTDVKNVVTAHMWGDLDVQAVGINARTVTSLVILEACATRKKSLNTRESQEHPEHINWWLVELPHKTHYVTNQMQV